MGVRVVATDISSKMLEVLQKHAEEAAVKDLIVPIHCRPYQLKERLGELGYTQVDGAYSTYGAVNTEPRLREFFTSLHYLIKPGGELILGVWNKYCMYEMLGYMLKGNPSMSVARLRNPVPVGKSRFCVATNAYSVRELANMLDGLFRLSGVYGVGIFLPPSNLTQYLPPGPFLPLAKKLDLTIQSHYPWNRLGDHFLGVYSRL
jgi:SAM-dependent methyltransferase